MAVGKLVIGGDTAVFTEIINASFASAKTGFEISLGLTGILSLWLGIMKIGEKGGVIQAFARLAAPVFSKLFPDIPRDHPVTGSIFMNLSANLLGLDNAATPMGLKAMHIVEGDSAGGSATQGRDSRFQAILPLWGKMLNVEKARADKVYGNDKLTPVITALGAGLGEEFDINKLRYHKVIIMADADVDGSHIRTLLLTFFFRFMRPLIDGGYVYSAIPPLYKLNRGKTSRVAFSDEERDRISAEMRGDNPNAKIDINRFKGLGEMDPHELWETTMNPETRTLKQITLEDAVHADEVFTVLMGEKVEPRKAFIEQNAKYAVNIDI